MSTLLHNVLASRLAAAAGGEGARVRSSDDEQALDEWEAVDSGASDDELVAVRSVPGTVPGTPFGLSRPPSPPPGAAGASSSTAAVGSAAEAMHHLTLAAAGRKRSALAVPGSSSSASGKATPSPRVKSKTDPLRAFPNVISQRIFLSLPVSALRSCSLVCKHWRRSATLNYCWYTYCQAQALDEAGTNPIPSFGSSGARWTRRESKIDWLSHMAKRKRLEARDEERAASMPGSGSATPSRTQRLAEQGVQTAAARNEERWQAEQGQEWSKADMREYYKTAGNKGGKLRGKSGKGGVKTGSMADGGLWE